MNELTHAQVSELQGLLGEQNLRRRPGELAAEAENTLGIDQRRILAVAYPAGTGEVVRLVDIAKRWGMPLYPISRGKNIGYGDKLPPGDGQLVVDLSRMNAIRAFDEDLALVTVEPGVSQQQLYEFLQRRPARFLMDSTGVGAPGSIVGNTLDGGFGHTPLGNRRREVVDVEVVLGTGEVVNASAFSLGPNLTGLFQQSNLGIVTAMTVRLMPEPEHVESYTVRAHTEEQLARLIAALLRLKQRGVIQGIPHIGNAVRSVVTVKSFPECWNRSEPLTSSDAVRLLSGWWGKGGLWTAIGALYGSRSEVAARRRALKTSLAGCGSTMFFSGRTLAMLATLSDLPFLRMRPAVRAFRDNITSLHELHRLMSGVPTEIALSNIGWRIEDPDDMGLIWCAPLFEPKKDEVARLLLTAEAVFERFKLEMPVTISLVDTHKAIAVFNISFRKSDAGEKGRAHDAYAELHGSLERQGFSFYRLSLLGQEHVQYEPGRSAALQRLKAAFDPEGIIAPGRYGIGSRKDYST